MMQKTSSVSDKKKKQVYWNCHFTNKVAFLFRTDFFVSPPCSTFWIIFLAPFSSISNYSHIWAPSPRWRSRSLHNWLVTWSNSVLLIGWGPKFDQRHDRICTIIKRPELAVETFAERQQYCSNLGLPTAITKPTPVRYLYIPLEELF